jgi:kanamycin nucleotidyltransferase
MPVGVSVLRVADAEKDINEIEMDWPLKMGRLFNHMVICGDSAILKRFREILEKVPKERFDEFLARETPLCYEGLGKLKAVNVRGNMHEVGLFVEEVLEEFMLLTAVFNRAFINYDYFGGLPESFKFKNLPQNYEKNAKKLMQWHSLTLDETINLADTFVHNFVSLLAENGIAVKEHTILEEVEM